MSRNGCGTRGAAWRAVRGWVRLVPVGCLWVFGGCSPEAPGPVEALPSKAAASAVTQTNTSPAGADLQKLVGRWTRTDGGYVVEVRSVDRASGKLDVGYFNPAPIHVAQAQAETQDGKVRVFVELQDVNYPGCTYRLTYFPQTDQLYGVYYQAAIQESFDVEFERGR